ncbi:hypothetical protein N7462_003592 [Penicillium macrosclerotiorum]|uniref:uncharacterized protein n=1 Tax=Penicillium macrosclerotiorum TaxID=303699 RepID=UPI002548B09F|nr:uncharacterized protein N7462_003592 [Penicillium macrosclerotiorum]KAJ5689200.1 hypothetical protein N7462_003592 [Penicillium macrosclerotiorum]
MAPEDLEGIMDDRSSESAPAANSEDEGNIHVKSPDLLPTENPQPCGGLEVLTNSMRQLADIISSSDLSRNLETKLHRHYKETRKLSEYQCPERRIIGFIGDSGVGKSSLINSLLREKDLARTSRAGQACTCVITEYRPLDQEHTQPYSIEVSYMNKDEMKELLFDLVQTFRASHVTEAHEDNESNISETESEFHTKSEQAFQTLESLFRNQSDFTEELLIGDPIHQTVENVTEKLMHWADAGLTNRPGRSTAHRHFKVHKNLDDCQETLDLFTTDQFQDKPAIWPFVKLIKYRGIPHFLPSPLIHPLISAQGILAIANFVYRLDIGRYASEKYMIESCDEVFVVADISRYLSDKSVEQVISACRPDQQKTLDVSPGESSRGTTPDALHVKEMNLRIIKLNTKIQKLNSERKRLRCDAADQDAVEELALHDEKTAIEFERTKYLITQRNSKVKAELSKRPKRKDLLVFCVSNTLYNSHSEREDDNSEVYLELSGIPQLQSHCHSILAKFRHGSVSAFLQREVPANLASLELWAHAGFDQVNIQKAVDLRRVLEEAQNKLRQDLLVADVLDGIHAGLNHLFQEHILSPIRVYKPEWSDACNELLKEWEHWPHGTYRAFCSHYGTHQPRRQEPRCWNEELIEDVIEVLIPQWDIMKKELKEYITSTPQDLARKLDNISKRLRGAGSHKRRKAAIREHLENSALCEAYIERANGSFNKTVISHLNKLQPILTEQVDSIVIDLQTIVAAEGQIPEAAKDTEFAHRVYNAMLSSRAKLQETQMQDDEGGGDSTL